MTEASRSELSSAAPAQGRFADKAAQPGSPTIASQRQDLDFEIHRPARLSAAVLRRADARRPTSAPEQLRRCGRWAAKIAEPGRLSVRHAGIQPLDPGGAEERARLCLSRMEPQARRLCRLWAAGRGAGGRASAADRWSNCRWRRPARVCISRSIAYHEGAATWRQNSSPISSTWIASAANATLDELAWWTQIAQSCARRGRGRRPRPPDQASADHWARLRTSPAAAHVRADTRAVDEPEPRREAAARRCRARPTEATPSPPSEQPGAIADDLVDQFGGEQRRGETAAAFAKHPRQARVRPAAASSPTGRAGRRAGTESRSAPPRARSRPRAAPASASAWWQSQSGVSRAVRPRWPARGSASSPLTTTRTGCGVVEAQAAHVELRIVARARSPRRSAPRPIARASDAPRRGARGAGDPAAFAGAGARCVRRARWRASGSASAGPSASRAEKTAVQRRRLDGETPGHRPRFRPPAAPPGPCRSTRGSGSSMATTTRATPGADQRLGAGRRLAAVIARFQRHIGGRAAAPRSPASASATVSACGRPPGCVQPRPDHVRRRRRSRSRPPGSASTGPNARRASPSADAHPARVLHPSAPSCGHSPSRTAAVRAQFRDEVLEVVRRLEVLVDGWRSAHRRRCQCGPASP